MTRRRGPSRRPGDRRRAVATGSVAASSGPRLYGSTTGVEQPATGRLPHEPRSRRRRRWIGVGDRLCGLVVAQRDTSWRHTLLLRVDCRTLVLNGRRRTAVVDTAVFQRRATLNCSLICILQTICVALCLLSSFHSRESDIAHCVVLRIGTDKPSGHFVKREQIGTLASQAEIGVWV